MAEAPAYWRRRGVLATLLRPLAWLFGLLAALRRRWLTVQHLPVPVIVVGNIAVGGSGKTPVVEWLVRSLQAAGHRPGIISRGHGGNFGDFEGVAEVPAAPLPADPVRYGDEPVLLRQRCACPVVVGRDRVAAARELLRRHPGCDVLVSDDGMQHYRLARTVEIAVLDPATLGNRLLLPAGPLREPLHRLQEVDLIIAHGALDAELTQLLASKPVFSMVLRGTELSALAEPERRRSLFELQGQHVHAVAGIGQPQRFFAQLEAAGLVVIAHPFPDHHRFTAADLQFEPAAPVLMTAKDAVKCTAFAPADSWVLPVAADIEGGAAAFIMERLF